MERAPQRADRCNWSRRYRRPSDLPARSPHADRTISLTLAEVRNLVTAVRFATLLRDGARTLARMLRVRLAPAIERRNERAREALGVAANILRRSTTFSRPPAGLANDAVGAALSTTPADGVSFSVASADAHVEKLRVRQAVLQRVRYLILGDGVQGQVLDELLREIGAELASFCSGPEPEHRGVRFTNPNQVRADGAHAAPFWPTRQQFHEAQRGAGEGGS